LPDTIPDEPPTNVETRSGLELKICLNTYKIFFVNNTEDYFYRKGVTNDRFAADLKIRHETFRKWLDSEHGWKKYDVSREVSDDKQQKIDEWMTSGGVEVEKVQCDGYSYRRFRLANTETEAEMEVDESN
jgi:paired amphipathic helix protein Sin3a